MKFRRRTFFGCLNTIDDDAMEMRVGIEGI